MSFLSFTPSPSTHVSLQFTSLPSTPSSFNLPDLVRHSSFSVLARLLFCLPVLLFFWTCFYLPTSHTHTHNIHVNSYTLQSSFWSLPLQTKFVQPLHATCQRQAQTDGQSAMQAADQCPHSPNEHPLSLGGQTQNQTANTAGSTATHYQPPACCDIPCALIVQHSYEPTNPSEITPKMRMTTFTTSPPTPRLYIQ
ncbi:hypothetical protein XENORESO_006640 [Xenotaenia resolanae]|uniref:Uncharacterized protein n=1 Tax=Xenotaenia resolanae TaxID=208358 RepID=A0ABV0WSJ7_9TELE